MVISPTCQVTDVPTRRQQQISLLASGHIGEFNFCVDFAVVELTVSVT